MLTVNALDTYLERQRSLSQTHTHTYGMLGSTMNLLLAAINAPNINYIKREKNKKRTESG